MLNRSAVRSLHLFFYLRLIPSGLRKIPEKTYCGGQYYVEPLCGRWLYYFLCYLRLNPFGIMENPCKGLIPVNNLLGNRVCLLQHAENIIYIFP